MLTPADLEKMAADFAEIIGDNDVSITIRRHESTLPAQTVRVEAAGTSRGRRTMQQGSGEEKRSGIVVVGPKSLDIRADDRFTVDGKLYRVVAVRSNKQAGIQADAELAQ